MAPGIRNYYIRIVLAIGGTKNYFVGPFTTRANAQRWTETTDGTVWAMHHIDHPRYLRARWLYDANLLTGGKACDRGASKDTILGIPPHASADLLDWAKEKLC